MPLKQLDTYLFSSQYCQKLQKTKIINWWLLIPHQQYQIVIFLWIYQWICVVHGSYDRNIYYHKTAGKNLEPLSGLFLESYLWSYLWRAIFQSVFSISLKPSYWLRHSATHCPLNTLWLLESVLNSSLPLYNSTASVQPLWDTLQHRWQHLRILVLR